MEDETIISKYDLSAWIDQLGSVPKELIAHEDQSESYEMHQATVYKLENGKFALEINRERLLISEKQEAVIGR